MPGEGRGLSSRPTQHVVRDLEIGRPWQLRKAFRNCRRRYTRKRRRKPAIASTPCTTIYGRLPPQDDSAGVDGIGCTNLSGLLMERFALLALMGSAAPGLIRSSAAQALSYIRLGSCGPCRRAISIHLAFCHDPGCRAEACCTSGSCILLLAAQQDPGDTCRFIGECYNCPIEAPPGNKRFQPS